ncbi:hypothetical protein EU805_01750 [Salipiger sp. IMCC34102]|uniref:hypothetical protein n=1 Tax=Salipiger sp. IMCC34102 TaxID=2510647 RepID=UPI00101D1524|nr:hypothetical protein [Salipiger sp. IMCC34102]RYH04121.1 hypothetical protein EU805_01750 [Salipiger sp. IMCC34102]
MLRLKGGGGGARLVSDAEYGLRHIPTSIKAGLTFALDLDLVDYPAPEWAAVVILSGPEKIELQSSPFGDLHRFAEPPAVTADWAPGLYAFTLRVLSNGDVLEIEAGQLKVSQDLASVDGALDPRSHAQRMLDAIEAVLERRATLDQESYTIGGRSLVRTPIGELKSLRESYRREVQKLSGDGKARRLLGRRVSVRFGR